MQSSWFAVIWQTVNSCKLAACSDTNLFKAISHDAAAVWLACKLSTCGHWCIRWHCCTSWYWFSWCTSWCWCYHPTLHLGGIWTPPPITPTCCTAIRWNKIWLLTLEEYIWVHCSTVVCLHNHSTGQNGRSQQHWLESKSQVTGLFFM